MAEKTIARIHPHRVAMLGCYIVAIALLAAALAVFFYPEVIYFYAPVYFWLNSGYVSLSLGAAGLAVLFLAEIAMGTHRYVITNERITKRKGLFTVWEDDILFSEVSRCSIKRSVFDRMFGDVGTIVARLGGGDESFLLEHVWEARKVKSLVDRLTGRVK